MDLWARKLHTQPQLLCEKAGLGQVASIGFPQVVVLERQFGERDPRERDKALEAFYRRKHTRYWPHAARVRFIVPSSRTTGAFKSVCEQQISLQGSSTTGLQPNDLSTQIISEFILKPEIQYLASCWASIEPGIFQV